MSEEDKGNKAACSEPGRQPFTICCGSVCVRACACSAGSCLNLLSVSAEEILVRRGSFLELDTYLHLSAERTQPIIHREMDVIQMSKSFQWPAGPQPHVRATN